MKLNRAGWRKMRFLVAAGIAVCLSYSSLKALSGLAWTASDRPPATEYALVGWSTWWKHAASPNFERAECRARLGRSAAPRIAHLVPEEVERVWNFRTELPWHDHLICSLGLSPMGPPERHRFEIRLTYLSTRWPPFVIDMMPGGRDGQWSIESNGWVRGGGRMQLQDAALAKISDRLDSIGFWDLTSLAPSVGYASPSEYWLIEVNARGLHHAVLRPRGEALAPVIDAVFALPFGRNLFPAGGAVADGQNLWR